MALLTSILKKLTIIVNKAKCSNYAVTCVLFMGEISEKSEFYM